VPVSNAPHRRRIAIAITSDGRRVQVPLESDEVTPLSLIRSLLVGIESVIALLIPGHRRDHGGTR
jgi:hypothetical protein